MLPVVFSLVVTEWIEMCFSFSFLELCNSSMTKLYFLCNKTITEGDNLTSLWAGVATLCGPVISVWDKAQCPAPSKHSVDACQLTGEWVGGGSASPVVC